MSVYEFLLRCTIPLLPGNQDIFLINLGLPHYFPRHSRPEPWFRRSRVCRGCNWFHSRLFWISILGLPSPTSKTKIRRGHPMSFSQSHI
jgi:hypothetical protein